MGLPNLMRKSDYHQLVRFVPQEQITPEIGSKLDAILGVSTWSEPHPVT